MKSSSAAFAQAVLVFIGLAVAALLLWEPHLEGRNVNATPFEIYFKDPFLAYVYVGSIPFFVALYRGFQLFGDVRRTGAFSQVSVDALRAIKRCGITLIVFVMGAAGFILVMGDKEDRPPGIVMSFIALSGAIALALIAAKFARHVQNSLHQSHRGAA
jgi:hypothetical protein